MTVSRQTASLWAAPTGVRMISPPASALTPSSLSGPAAFRCAMSPLGSLTACLPVAALPATKKHRGTRSISVLWAAAGNTQIPTLPVAIVQGRRQGQGPQQPFPAQRPWEQGRGGQGAWRTRWRHEGQASSTWKGSLLWSWRWWRPQPWRWRPQPRAVGGHEVSRSKLRAEQLFQAGGVNRSMHPRRQLIPPADGLFQVLTVDGAAPMCRLNKLFNRAMKMTAEGASAAISWGFMRRSDGHLLLFLLGHSL